jgi:hypothetical protein
MGFLVGIGVGPKVGMAVGKGVAVGAKVTVVVGSEEATNASSLTTTISLVRTGGEVAAASSQAAKTREKIINRIK